MKKKSKVALFALTAAASAVAVNKLIFYSARQKNQTKLNEGHYDWKYGRVRYVTCGDGEPLLLIHGVYPCGSLGLYEWDECIKALSKRYRVYAIDLPGYGYSDKPAISYSSYLYIQFINDFIRNVIKKRTYVAASSHSAALAVAAADFAPELFKKLLLISPANAAKSGLSAKKQTLLRRLFESPIAGTSLYNIFSSKPYINRFLTMYGLSGNTAKRPLINKFYYPSHYPDSKAKYSHAAYMAGYFNVDIERLLTKTDDNIPVHIVCCADNLLNPAACFSRLKTIRPDISLTVFNAVKLFPHIENPRDFYKLCKGFFG